MLLQSYLIYVFRFKADEHLHLLNKNSKSWWWWATRNKWVWAIHLNLQESAYKSLVCLYSAFCMYIFMMHKIMNYHEQQEYLMKSFVFCVYLFRYLFDIWLTSQVFITILNTQYEMYRHTAHNTAWSSISFHINRTFPCVLLYYLSRSLTRSRKAIDFKIEKATRIKRIIELQVALFIFFPSLTFLLSWILNLEDPSWICIQNTKYKLCADECRFFWFSMYQNLKVSFLLSFDILYFILCYDATS